MLGNLNHALTFFITVGLASLAFRALLKWAAANWNIPGLAMFVS